MKKYFYLILTILLTGCSTTADITHYRLTSHSHDSFLKAGTNEQQLWVEQISLPDYLDSDGIVFQSSEVRYTIARNNLWATSLRQQLQQTLIANLNATLPGTLISATSQGPEQDKLTINITGFHGRYDGRGIISGDWVLEHRGKFISRSFMLTPTQHNDGYDGLVKVLSAGWLHETNDIARVIQSVND